MHGHLTCVRVWIYSQVHLNDDSVLSVVTYAVAHLKVKHGGFAPVSRVRMGLIRYPFLVVVVGHSQCGGAAACLKAADGPPPPDKPTVPLLRWLTPLTNLVRTLDLGLLGPAEALSLVVKENVKQQVQNLAKTDPIKEAWAQGQDVQIHGWVYNIPTGTLADLGVTVTHKK